MSVCGVSPSGESIFRILILLSRLFPGLLPELFPELSPVSEPRGTWGSSGLGEPAVRAGEPAGRTWGNLPGQLFSTALKILSKNPSRTSLVREYYIK